MREIFAEGGNGAAEFLPTMPAGTPVKARTSDPESVERRKMKSGFSSLSVFRTGKRETRGRVRTPEARKGFREIRRFRGKTAGVHNIMPMKNRQRREDGIPHRLRTKGVDEMLNLNLNQGEYLTIGRDVVIQVDRVSGDRCKLMIQAPREIPVLRGKVLERAGGERPDCVFDTPRWHRRELTWDRSKAQALSAMRRLLSQMDGEDDNVRSLRRQLNQIFPGEGETPNVVSNG